MNDYYDLGVYKRKISTDSEDAQIWFNRGLIWCFGYNHDESVSCFKKALEFDPKCAMAWWGIAYASGCNYNKPWEAFDEQDALNSVATAYDATQNALKLLNNITPIEQAFIKALPHRYPSRVPTEDMNSWNDEFANAMRKLYQRFDQDFESITFFVEAIMNRTPWALWDLKTGKPEAGADTEEAVITLEKAMTLKGAMQHPGILHLYIHLMEMSAHPERALKAADALRDLVPDAGHLVHMPTHIDVLCGNYERVVSSNTAAIIADKKFLKRNGAINFYSLYRSHNYHFTIYGAMFLGQYQTAISAADEMISTLPDTLLEVKTPPMADWLEGFIAMKQHIYIRFGKWQAIIDQPLPKNSTLYCVTTAMMYYAKSVAYAATGDVVNAEIQAKSFDQAIVKVPESRFIFNNSCLEILAVAKQMMLGEIEYRKQNYPAAFTHLRESVHLSDTLTYDEPWGWMQPTRHALGALLLEQNHVEESASVYKADLGLDDTLSRACHHPDNVWSLLGYHECLLRLGKTDEAMIIKQRLDIAKARTDISLKSSCFCKIGSQ